MGSERIAGGHVILFVPDLPAEAGVQSIVGSIETSADVDIVVGQGGAILKDRHGNADAALLRLRASLATADLSTPEAQLPPPPGTPALLGVPLDRIEAITLDGAHWLEVFNTIERWDERRHDPTLVFRVAQAPGGKKRKLGIGQGDLITVPESAVRGVMRKTNPTFSLEDNS